MGSILPSKPQLSDGPVAARQDAAPLDTALTLLLDAKGKAPAMVASRDCFQRCPLMNPFYILRFVKYVTQINNSLVDFDWEVALFSGGSSLWNHA